MGTAKVRYHYHFTAIPVAHFGSKGSTFEIGVYVYTPFKTTTDRSQISFDQSEPEKNNKGGRLLFSQIRRTCDRK